MSKKTGASAGKRRAACILTGGRLIEALRGFQPTKYAAFENSSADANFEFYTCSFSKFIGLLAYQKLQKSIRYSIFLLPFLNTAR